MNFVLDLLDSCTRGMMAGKGGRAFRAIFSVLEGRGKDSLEAIVLQLNLVI
jgi:hypothetical protein